MSTPAKKKTAKKKTIKKKTAKKKTSKKKAAKKTAKKAAKKKRTKRKAANKKAAKKKGQKKTNRESKQTPSAKVEEEKSEGSGAATEPPEADAAKQEVTANGDGQSQKGPWAEYVGSARRWVGKLKSSDLEEVILSKGWNKTQGPTENP